MAAAYKLYLDRLELVQGEQAAVLRRLARDHGVRRMLVEGLTPSGLADYHDRAAPLRGLEATGDESRRRLLEAGAVGRLVAEGVVEAAPLDDDGHSPDPLGPLRWGRVDYGPDGKGDPRWSAMVRRAVAEGASWCSCWGLSGAGRRAGRVPEGLDPERARRVREGLALEAPLTPVPGGGCGRRGAARRARMPRLPRSPLAAPGQQRLAAALEDAADPAQPDAQEQQRRRDAAAGAVVEARH